VWMVRSLSGYEEFCFLGYIAVWSVEGQPSFRRNTSLLATFFALVFCLTYSSTLKMEATCSSGTSVDFRQTTRRYTSIPEDRTLPGLRIMFSRYVLSTLIMQRDNHFVSKQLEFQHYDLCSLVIRR
jgi:hypothetical protein